MVFIFQSGIHFSKSYLDKTDNYTPPACIIAVCVHAIHAICVPIKGRKLCRSLVKSNTGEVWRETRDSIPHMPPHLHTILWQCVYMQFMPCVLFQFKGCLLIVKGRYPDNLLSQRALSSFWRIRLEPCSVARGSVTSTNSSVPFR